MKRLILVLLTGIAAPRLFAGADYFSTYSHPTEKDSVSALPEVEILAKNKPEQISSATPIFEIDAEKMKITGVTSVADALRRIPGVNLRDYGGAGGLKTVSVRGLGAKHTGVSYDGVYLSDLRSGEIDLSKYSLENIGGLSVIAGDNDDIFSPARNISSATEIALSTIRDPHLWERNFILDTRFKTGSFGLYNPFLRTGYSNRSDFSITGMAEFTHAHNNYPFTLVNGKEITREKRTNSQLNSIHSEINAIYKPTALSELLAKIYFYNSARYLPGPVKYYVNKSNEHLSDNNFFSQARYRIKLSSFFSFSALAKFNWTNTHYEDINGIYPGGRLDEKYYQREFYTSASLLSTPLSNLSINYSIDWFFNNLSSNLRTESHPNRNSLLQALSAKYTFSRIKITGNILYSYYRDSRQKVVDGLSETRETISFSRFSPSIAISVSPFEEFPLHFRASYKDIMRIPTFTELYFDNYGSIDLKPERTTQYNFGITFTTPKSSFLRELSFTADGYINRIKDKIVAIPYNLFKWTMTNLGKVRILGVDLTLNTQIGLNSANSIVMTGSYSYQRAETRTNPSQLDWKKQVAYTPLNSGSGSLSWLNPWLSVAVNFNAVSSRYTTNTNLPSTLLPGYAEFGCSVFRTFVLKKGTLDVRADLINIFDHQYQIVARYPMPGRSWSASVGYSF